MMLGNHTVITEFILLGFGDFHKLQTLLFVTFLVIYIVTITGNLVILLLVISDRHLHIPMYFFLGNLSFLEFSYSSNILPRLLLALRSGDRGISFSSCFIQWYICACSLVTECWLLCAMSYDRYLAICKPLHYATIMNIQKCIKLAAASWINGYTVFVILLTLMLQQLTFCGANEIDHYFCDFWPLLKLSCSDIRLLEHLNFVVVVLFVLLPFLLILTSYLYIAIAILKIPSTAGRQKAFSTCSSHLVVVSMYYGSLMIVYMLPKSEAMQWMEKFSSLLYIVLPPLANPFIYSLRNKEVKIALRKIFYRLVPYKASSKKRIHGTDT